MEYDFRMRVVAVLGSPSATRHRVFQRLQGSDNYAVNLYSHPMELIKDLKNHQFLAIVMITGNMSLANSELLAAAREKLDWLPIFLVTQGVSPRQRRALYNAFQLRVVDRHHEINDLSAYVRSSVVDGDISQRADVRYKTRVPVIIGASNGTGVTLGGVMENVSKSGAKLRPERLTFAANDRLKVTFFSPSGKERTLDSIVRWIDLRQQAIGVEFC